MNITLDQEQEQFELLQAGDKTGYAYFYRRHQEGIYYYIRRMGAEAELAKGLSQDVFKQLWDLRASMTSAPHLAAYIYVMARYLFVDYARKLQRMPAYSRDLAYAARLEAGANKELELICQRVLNELRLAMKGLTDQRRLVLKLLYVQGLEVPAVAELLNVSPQTVRNTKSQATNFLRRKLYDRDLLMSLSLPGLLAYMEELDRNAPVSH
jgi:RNA polymerase sigma-70 factor (ECF subfamily)